MSCLPSCSENHGARFSNVGLLVPSPDRPPRDRYKQQIAEMEAAMKSTWEEKAKQSESSERERQRLQHQASGSSPVSCL